MNAITYIQQYGVDRAREVMKGAPNGATHIRDSYGYVAYLKDGVRKEWYHNNTWLMTLVWQPDYLLSDLKRLVESVDRINSCGGLYGFKTYCNGDFSQEDLQAITDCEAIYSNDIKIEVSFGVSLMPAERLACIDLTPRPVIDCEILDHPEDYTSPNCKKFDERVNSNETK